MPIAIPHSTDFARIAALPRRRVSKDDAVAWARALTPDLRRAGSRATLVRWQGYCLAEAAENDGGFFGLTVGQGKTLLAEMLPVVMNARRPALLIGASLREKTYADRRALMNDWQLHNPPPRIVSREELALEQNAYLLDELAPDLLIIDEADEWSNTDSSAVRRVDRYVRKMRGEHGRDAVRVVAMTGTPIRNSILDMWHLLCWALDDGAPMPMRESEARLWAGALDNKGDRGAMSSRVRPGPLGPDLEAAREWFRARLVETPGVVIIDEDSAEGVPLTIRTRLANECPEIDRHFERFMVDQENPDGQPVSTPLSRWLMGGQLGCGLFSYYDPEPPEAWRDARRAFAAFVRNAIEASTRRGGKPLDTERQVSRAFEDHPTVRAWLGLKDTFDQKRASHTAWLSDATIDSAIAWLDESPAIGIVWCGSVEFAERLAERTGLPYYGPKGQDQRGRGLHVAPHENLICSWNANKKGFNLQAWTRQLIVMPPQSAKWLEQIYGRSHRAGQTRHVTIDVLATSGGTLDGFETAIGEAGFGRAVVSLTQKVMRAEIVRATPTRTRSNRFRWARK
jgi:hypothetical protein